MVLKLSSMHFDQPAWLKSCIPSAKYRNITYFSNRGGLILIMYIDKKSVFSNLERHYKWFGCYMCEPLLTPHFGLLDEKKIYVTSKIYLDTKFAPLFIVFNCFLFWVFPRIECTHNCDILIWLCAICNIA